MHAQSTETTSSRREGLGEANPIWKEQPRRLRFLLRKYLNCYVVMLFSNQKKKTKNYFILSFRSQYFSHAKKGDSCLYHLTSISHGTKNAQNVLPAVQ